MAGSPPDRGLATARPVVMHCRRGMARRIHRPLGIVFAGALLVCGCRVSIDEEHLGEGPAFARAETLCVYLPPEDVDWGGGFSLPFGTEAYWIFSETVVDSGGAYRFLSNAGAVSHRAPMDCSGELEPVVDAEGSLAQVIPFTEDEIERNETRTDGRRFVIWPTSGFVHDGVGWVFFRKVLLTNYFDLATIGVGVARIDLGGIAERLAPGRYADEPSLTWLSPQDDWGTGAFLGMDGHAYVHGCFERSSWDWVCRLARVDPESAGDPDAYEYWDGSGWSDRVEQAVPVMTGATGLSIAWNGYLGKYLAVHTRFLANDVVARTAAEPWGPWSDPIDLFTGEAPSEFWIRDLHQHRAYATDDGRSLLLSYYSTPAAAPAGMRIVRLDLE